MKVNIFGATGLVGNLLLQECLTNEKISQIKIFVRKPIELIHPKLQQVTVTYDSLEQMASEIEGDVVFNCLGTTLKQAGSQSAQYQVDCEYPIKVAQLAAKNGVKSMVNVSSVGTSESSNFYLKTKADMERGVAAAIGSKSYFMRPSFIVGDRKDFRLGEKIGIFLALLINPLMIGGLRKYRSIEAKKIAMAMLQLGINQPNDVKILHFDEIKYWANYK